MTLVPPPGVLPVDPTCPFCDGRDTELFNPFGSQLSVATYWCRPCKSPFEFFKWAEEESPSEDRPAPGARAGSRPASEG